MNSLSELQNIQGVWSDNGELLQFMIRTMGIPLEGKLQGPPKVLEIGTIDSIGGFEGVKKKNYDITRFFYTRHIWNGY